MRALKKVIYYYYYFWCLDCAPPLFETLCFFFFFGGGPSNYYYYYSLRFPFFLLPLSPLSSRLAVIRLTWIVAFFWPIRYIIYLI